MRSQLLALQRLEKNPDYAVLQAFWIPLIAKIEEARDRAASRSQESAWRYAAGQEKGAKLIAGALALAIAELELTGQDESPSEDNYDALLKEARGELK